jgi:hypothetical protein
MKSEERRVILDRSFDAALGVVLDAFAREGFAITIRDAGDVHRPGTPGHTRRYAAFEAALPELTFGTTTRLAPAVLGCRVSMFELTWACTLVTAEEPVAHYPVLAALVPRISERIGHAIQRLRAQSLPQGSCAA